MNKIFIIIIFFSLCFISPSQADDIRDFQIEGISIGDSALDYIDKDKLISKKKDWFKSNKYSISADFEDFELDFLKTYDGLQFVYLTNDNEFKLHGIEALKFFRDNVKECYSELDSIAFEISKLFETAKLSKSNSYRHTGDKLGKTMIMTRSLRMLNGDTIAISCYDWSKEIGYWDQLRISLRKNEYINFLINDAY